MGNEDREFDQEHLDLRLFCSVKIGQTVDATMAIAKNIDL
jgi:hypothetical protein